MTEYQKGEDAFKHGLPALRGCSDEFLCGWLDAQDRALAGPEKARLLRHERRNPHEADPPDEE